MLTYHPFSRDSDPAGRTGATVWIDLLQPTSEEIARVETEFRVRVPSREQLDEIESSSRLRSEEKRLYLSMPVAGVHEVVDGAPTPLGFVVSPELLITVRYRALGRSTRPAIRSSRKGVGQPARRSSSRSSRRWWMR